MNKIIGAIIISLGAFIGLYIGVYELLFKGILDVVEFFQQDNAESSLLAFGILRIMFASAVGWASFAVTAFIGALVFTKD